MSKIIYFEEECRILTNINWCIQNPINTIPNLKNLLILEGYPFIIIYFQIDRDGFLDSVPRKYQGNLDFKNPEDWEFTAADILQHIHRFYSAPLNEDSLEKLAETSDTWGYNKLAQKALENSTVLYQYEVMGKTLNFQGLEFREIEEGIPAFDILLEH